MDVHLEENLKQLKNSFLQHAVLHEREWHYFHRHLSQHRFAQREHLTRFNDSPGQFHFITKGLVQLAYPDTEGRPVIKSFAREHEMTGPLIAWMNAEASPIEITAVEHTETLGFPSRLAPKLMQMNPVWEQIVRGYIEQLAKKTEQRALSFMRLTPEQRYLAFIEEEPQLYQRLPLHLVAAYLGITDVSLSRIRKRINKG